MPWAERNLMSLRMEFIHLANAGGITMTALCRRFGISRKTGYKWLHRYAAGGATGLADRSRRPRTVREQVPAATRRFLLNERATNPAWGARKLRRRAREQRLPRVPACSTITTLLHREGLMGAANPPGQRPWQRFEHPVPNSLWQMDFKGRVLTQQGPIHPLTALDDHSRFNVCLRALPDQQTLTVQQTLVEIFRRYGLPTTLLVDNGSPWGDTGKQPYTVLTVWWIRLGIRVRHSRPYHPQTLGKDERFHGTLNRELLHRAHWQDGVHLQRAFDHWRTVYNHERPHDALGLAVPASRYRPSARPYPETLPAIEYESGVTVRRVQQGGAVHFQGRIVTVSKAFRGLPVGIIPTGQDGVYELWFCHQRVRMIDLRRPPQENVLPMSPVRL